ncbi:MAG: hypothetical protein WB297_16250 [Actinomycetota bacterium]
MRTMLGIPVFPSSPAFPIEGGGVVSTIVAIVAVVAVAAFCFFWARSQRVRETAAVTEFPTKLHKAA